MLNIPDIPVFFCIVMIAYLILVGAVSWVAWNREDDGVRGLALFLCTNIFGFLLLSQYNTLPHLVVIPGYYTLGALSNVFLLYGLKTFFAQKMHWSLWLGLCALLLFLLITFDNDLIRQTQLADVFYLLQNLVFTVTLLRRKVAMPSCGSNMLLAGNILSLILTLWWLVMTLRAPAALYTGPHHLDKQMELYFTTYILMLLITNGFILMTKERAQAELQANLRQDSLTGLNKSQWIEEAARAHLARLKRFAMPASLVLLDIDHYRETNRQCGYDNGNRILQQLSDVLRREISGTCELFRMKGGRFAVLVPGFNMYRVMEQAERILAAIANGHFAGESHITVSGGVAIATGSDSWTSWLFRAQHALQKAKAYGRNQIQVEEIDFTTRNLPNGVTRVGLLHWHPAYSTGNALIDSQHRELFERTNALLQLWARTDDKQTIANAVGDFLKLAKSHFDYESDLLQKAKTNPGQLTLIEKHSESHTRLSRRATDLFARYQQSELTNDALFNFLVFEFVVTHISAEDCEIAPVLRTVA